MPFVDVYPYRGYTVKKAFKSYERMIDAGTPRSAKFSIKPVRHTKYSVPAFEPIGWFRGAAPGRVTYGADMIWIPTDHMVCCEPLHYALEDAYVYYAKWKIDHTTDISTLIGMPPSRLGELASRIVKRLDEVHISTTIIESRDFPQLFRLFSPRGSPVEAIRAVEKTVRTAKGAADAAKKLARAIREGSLGWGFGLAPTIADAKNIANEVRRGARKSRRTEFSVAVSGSGLDTYTASVRGPYYKSSYESCNMNERIEAIRIDGCHVIDTRPPFAYEVFNDLSDAIDRYAGHNPAGLLWEVIPYSWAVDWFLSLDNVIDSLFLRMQNRFELHYWSSTKIEYTRRHDVYFCSNISGAYPGPVDTSPKYYDKTDLVVKSSIYERSVAEPPNPLTSLQLRGTSLTGWYYGLCVAMGLRGK